MRFGVGCSTPRTFYRFIIHVRGINRERIIAWLIKTFLMRLIFNRSEYNYIISTRLRTTFTRHTIKSSFQRRRGCSIRLPGHCIFALNLIRFHHILRIRYSGPNDELIRIVSDVLAFHHQSIFAVTLDFVYGDRLRFKVLNEYSRDFFRIKAGLICQFFNIKRSCRNALCRSGSTKHNL